MPKTTLRKTHWLFVVAIIIIGFITAVGILCWQGSIIVRGQHEDRQQALAVQTQIYQAHQAKNDQWLTYTNSQYGFEFKYPQNGEIITTGAQSAEICVEIKHITSPYVGAYWLCVFSAEPDQTLQDYMAVSDARFSSRLTILNPRQITIGQAQGIQRTEQWLGTNKNTLETYIKNGNLIYNFHFSSVENLSSSRLNNDKKIYNAILSTFKFTD